MRRRFVFFAFLVSLLGVLFLAPSLEAAQSGTGQIIGTITDISGAVIPGATVTATREQAASVVTRTNEAGRYTFPSLTPGNYTVTVEAPNFKKVVLTDVIVQVGGVVTRDVVLQPGEITEEIVVTAASQPVVEVGKGPSLGDVVDARRVLDLPLNGRNPLDLVGLQAGVVGSNISGTRTTSNNIRVDGIQAQDNYIASAVQLTLIPTSVEDVAEFRVTTSPADAEFGRGGGGQVDIVTRSGTNEFHGSVFNFHRNTALNANTFFNNRLGRNPDGTPVAPREVLLRNQFGFRVAGPVFKDRTFFFYTYEGQRESTGVTVTPTVLTEPARRGLFRFFPNVSNGNASSPNPTVDAQGNPLPPSNLTLADLRQINLFAEANDPRRSQPDASRLVADLIGLTPLPNNFTVGDGLNTAGFTFFAPIKNNPDQFTIRIDHNFNQNHRLSGVYRLGGTDLRGQIAGNLPASQNFQVYPGLGVGGLNSRDQGLSLSLVSSLSPTVTNEFRAGFQRARIRFQPPEEGGLAAVGRQLPTIQGAPISLIFATITDPINSFEFQGRVAPVYEYIDTVTWIRGNHEFRGGADIRFIQANTRDEAFVRPRVTLGEVTGTAVNFPSAPINTNDVQLARNILYDLTGSIASIRQAFRTPDLRVLIPFIAENRGYRKREFNFFFRDNWRVTPSLTLNLGVRYEYNTVPFEVNGLLVQPTLGPGHTRFEAALGVSNRAGSYADLFRPFDPNVPRDPGLTGPTGFERVGPGQPNQLFKDDYNNFLPAIGISWSPNFQNRFLRWLFGGESQSVIRSGYLIGYDAFPLVLFDNFSGANPGLVSTPIFVPQASANAVSRLDNLLNVTLPIPITDTRALAPTDFQRNNPLLLINENLRTPYVQNWNFSIQRELDKDTVVEFRYVGTKGTKLVRTENLNEFNIIENLLADEFNFVRQQLLASGNPSTFIPNQLPETGILRALFNPIPGGTVRDRNIARAFLDSLGFRQLLLQGEYLLIAFNIDNEVLNFNGVPVRGGRIARAGLPVNFIRANPQFFNSLHISNFSNSTYHAAQVEIRRRLAKGLQFQANYTFSKALGDGLDIGFDQAAFTTNFRTVRNRAIEKRPLRFDRRHVVKINGLYELPFGPGKRFLNGARGVVGKLVEGWQINGIFSAFSGRPIDFSSGRFTLFGATGLNSLPPNPGPGFDVSKLRGKVTRLGDGVTFFPGLSNPFADQFNLNRQVVDENGNILLVTPEPGTAGTLGFGFISGPGEVNLDASLLKRTYITETINVEFRAEFFNLPNNVNFGTTPTTLATGLSTSIQSTTFGRFTSQSNDPRIIQFAVKVNF